MFEIGVVKFGGVGVLSCESREVLDDLERNVLVDR